MTFDEAMDELDEVLGDHWQGPRAREALDTVEAEVKRLREKNASLQAMNLSMDGRERAVWFERVQALDVGVLKLRRENIALQNAMVHCPKCGAEIDEQVAALNARLERVTDPHPELKGRKP